MPFYVLPVHEDDHEPVRVRDGDRVGRGADCQLQFDASELEVSKQHAEFRLRDGLWVVRDLNSSNGTWVNGQRVTESDPLFSGDLVRFGLSGPALEIREDLLGEASGSHPALEDTQEALPVIEPLDEEDQDLRALATDRRALAFERARLHRRRELHVRRERAVVALVAVLALAFGLAWRFKPAPPLPPLEEQLAACREADLTEGSDEEAERCEALLSSLFDELAAECSGEVDDLPVVEDRCARVEDLAFSVAAERSAEYRREYQAAVAAAESELPGFERSLVEVLALLGAPGVPIDALPPAFVDEVARIIARHQAPAEHGAVQRQLCRKEACFEVFRPHFRRVGLPLSYGYIAWEESRFEVRASSAVGAAGLWQLMPETARQLGLVVEQGDGARDDRLSVPRSTRAATRYLDQLRDEFAAADLEVPLLVMAAYNGGQGRVKRSQQALGPVSGAVGRSDAERADFITLWLHERLPAETRAYVPRILAWAMIGEFPERFGFDADRCTPTRCY